MRPSERQGRTWDEVPETIKNTFERVGIPEAERKFLAGVSAQYESEVVYHSIREDLERRGVIFLDMESGVRDHPDLVRRGTVIPPNDNKFAALNSAVWSGGALLHGPRGARVNVRCDALLIDPASRSDTYPTRRVARADGRVEHEATVSKVGDERRSTWTWSSTRPGTPAPWPPARPWGCLEPACAPGGAPLRS